MSTRLAALKLSLASIDSSLTTIGAALPDASDLSTLTTRVETLETAYAGYDTDVTTNLTNASAIDLTQVKADIAALDTATPEAALDTLQSTVVT